MKKVTSKLVCCFLLSFTFNSLLAQNLLTTNPSFELGKKGWYFDNNKGTVSLIDNGAKEGKAALKIVSNEGDGPKPIYTKPEEQKLIIEAGKKYKLEVWVKPVVKTYGVGLKVYASTGFKAKQDLEQEIKGNKLKMGEWQLVSFDFTGNDYPNAKLSFYITLGEVWVDDFKLYEVK